jgi:lipopolysaccharide/colanic/teichoic acid biosynthesis glycosyltransferase
MKKIGTIILNAFKNVLLALLGAMFFCLVMIVTIFAVKYFSGDPMIFSEFLVGGVFGAVVTKFILEMK